MLVTIEKSGKHKSSANHPAERMERIVITPEIAAAWLDKNVRNRKISRQHVDKLARDMRAGRFLFTGDAVRFDASGNLIDGQHRLAACVKSQCPFETLVIYGMADDVQDKLDSGKSRNTKDVISLHGFHNANHLVGACRLLMAERDGTDARRAPYTTSDVFEFMNKHPYMAASVRDACSKKMPVGISFSQLACVYYVGAHLLGRQTAAAEFIEVMRTGVPTYENDAAHAYRERIIRSGGGITSLKADEKWRLMKHAWNLFRDRQPSKILRGGTEVGFNGIDIKAV